MKKSRAGIYILAGLVALALLWLIFRLAPSSNIDTPKVVLPTAPASGADVSSGASGDEGTSILVTPDTVQAAIATLSRADSYSRTLVVESFWSGGGSSRKIDVWARGDSTRLAIDDSSTVKNVLIEGEKLWIWYSGSDSVYTGSASEGDADEYQSLLTYEEVLELDKSAISDAGYTEFGGVMCIYVSYTSGSFGYENRCYIDVDTGLLMGLETYDGETLIYSMSSTKPDVTTPDDSVFTKPN